MKKYIIVGFLLGAFVINAVSVSAQKDSEEIFFYKKAEQTLGIRYIATETREELRSDNTLDFEELTTGNAQFQFTTSFLNFLDFKQEQFAFDFELGPLWGNGNIIDSSNVDLIEADQNIFGIHTQANINYVNRFYYDRKNYTLVDVSAWGQLDYYNRNSDGSAIDTNGVKRAYDATESVDKFTYGFKAKAGWGIGRLNPMNNFMVAEHILKKYYAGRNFSEAEIIEIADEVGRIKADRLMSTENNLEKEAESLQKYLNEKLFLTAPDNLMTDWQYGEFFPRYNGTRAEAGPFFQYYNQEPDFVYGGYIQVNNSKYYNSKWNRNFSASINYNRYKRQDWMLAEVDLGWSFYPNLKSQWDFGVKYIPGMVVNRFEDVEPVVHSFVPYLGCYAQINPKLRIKANASLRIADDEQFVLAGPEFSLAVYWSKY